MERYFDRCSVILLTLLLVIFFPGCLEDGDDEQGIHASVNPREAMKELVQNISGHAKGIDSDFIVVTQNGNELLFSDKELLFTDMDYFSSIDGVSQEDLFFGFEEDNEPTSNEERDYLLNMLIKARSLNKTVMVTDYCSDHAKMDSSYEMNAEEGFISFAADRRELDDIPDHPIQPNQMNTEHILELTDAKNFLYLIDPERFEDRDAYLRALRGTDHDLLIIDLFFRGTMLTSSEIGSLKVKESGGSRLVLSYMSIGEAEDYRYYWQTRWGDDPPLWLDEENPEWEGNYKVHYWDADWHGILYGGESSFLDRIMKAGFDGAYLDLIDAFEYYE